MSSTASEGKFDGRAVIALALAKEASRCLEAAFPDHTKCSEFEDAPRILQETCTRYGSIVVFQEMSGGPSGMWSRTSSALDRAHIKVIGVSPLCSDAVFDAALAAEFDGALQRDASAAVFRRAVQSVLRGELWFPRAYMSRKMREARIEPYLANMSVRETEVLNLVAAGATNQAIADALYISRDTVRWHLRSIYTKLGVSDREAVYRIAKHLPVVPQSEV